MSTDTQNKSESKVLDPKANLNALIRIAVIVVVLLGGVWLFIRYTAGGKVANRVISTISHQPIDLVSTTQDLPASSFKALPLSLPYSGTLDVNVAVQRGNPISIFVVTPDQIEKIKSKQTFSSFAPFEADKTQTYSRSGRLQAGSYYLVLLDKTLGILSQKSSDVQVRARLEP